MKAVFYSMRNKLKKSEKEKYYDKAWIVFCLVIAAFVFVLAPTISKATEYPSWMRTGESEVYGGRGTPPTDSDEDKEVSQSTVTKEVASLMDNMALSIDVMDRSEPGVFSINLDGVILGRLAGYTLSCAKFELFEYNPYGVVGAHAYVVIRNIVFALLLISFVIGICKMAFPTTTGAKELSLTKEMIQTLLIVFLFIYFMPAIANWFIVLRDSIIGLFSDVIKNSPNSNPSIVSSALAAQRAMRNGTLGGVLLYLAMLCGGVFVLAGYVGTALLCLVYFAAFPIVALLALRDKRILKAWSGAFFSNLAIPLVDYVILSAIVVLTKIIQMAAERTGQTTNFWEDLSLPLIWLVAIWGFVPARNVFIRLFGGQTPASSAGMLAAGAMMAMRMAGRGVSSLVHGGRVDPDIHRSNIEKFNSDNENFTNASRDSFKALRDLDEGFRTEPTIGSLDQELSTGLNSIPKSGDMGIEGTSAEKAGTSLNGGNIEVESGSGEEPIEAGMPEAEAKGPESATGDFDELDEGDGKVTASEELGADMSPNMDNDGPVTMDEIWDQRLDNLEKADNLERVINGEGAEAKELASAKTDYEGYSKTWDTYSNNQGTISDLGKANDALYSQKEKIEQGMLDGSISAAEGSNKIGGIQKSIDFNNAKMADLNAENSALVTKMSEPGWKEGFAGAKERYTKAQTNYDLAQSNAKSELAHRRDIERSFATQDKINGGTGVTYSDASSFKQVVADNRAKRERITSDNYTQREFAGLTTPEERYKYAKRERAINTAAHVAGAVVGTAGAVTAGAASAFGGPSAMTAGAVAGSLAGRKTESLVNSAAHVKDRHQHTYEALKEKFKYAFDGNGGGPGGGPGGGSGGKTPESKPTDNQNSGLTEKRDAKVLTERAYKKPPKDD